MFATPPEADMPGSPSDVAEVPIGEVGAVPRESLSEAMRPLPEAPN
jgi:hypothetical protein